MTARVLAASLLFASVGAHAASPVDAEMQRLAKRSGCYLCHGPGAKAAAGQGRALLGPTWKDIAQRYQGQKGAAERLTRTVLSGTGQKAADRHWAGKAPFEAMPANAGEISADNAAKLVRWILSQG